MTQRRSLAMGPHGLRPWALSFAALCLASAGPARAAPDSAAPVSPPDLLTQATNAHRSDDLIRAWDLARQAIAAERSNERSNQPPSAAAHLLFVEIARDARRLAEAKAYLGARDQGGRNQAAAEWALGLLHLWRNEFRTAIPHFERAVSLNPGVLDPCLGLAECHEALGDRSLDWLKSLRERSGFQWTEMATRAQVLDATGRTREALALYEEAARSAPEHPEIRRLLAVALARQGQLARANASLDRAAELARALPAASGSPLRGGTGGLTDGDRALAAIELTRARIDLQSARYDDALAAATRAHVHANQGADRARLAQALTLEGVARTEKSDAEAARGVILQGLKLARRIGDDQSERAALEALALAELNTFQTRSASERLKAALARSAETGDARHIESTLTLLGRVDLARGEYLEALAYFNDASARARESGATWVQQQAVEGASRALLLLGEYWQANDLALSALALAEHIGAQAGVCQSLITAGRAAHQLGLYDQAELELQRAAGLAGRLGLDRIEGRAYLQLGFVAGALGQTDMAQGWFREALAKARVAKDPALEADGVSAIGQGFLEVGAFDEALREFERALVLATETGYLEGRLDNLTRAAEVHKLLGDYRRSVALFQESLNLSSGLRNRLSQATNYSHLGEIYASLGDLNKSLNFLDRALRTHRETGSVPGEGECLLSICRAYNLTGTYEAGVARCGEALTFADAHGNDAQRAIASIEIGKAYLGLGRAEQAEPYFRAGRDLARSLDRPSLQWPAAAGMSQVLAAQGKNEPAIRMGREAVATLEKLRNDLDLPEMRAGFLEDRLEPYEQLVLLLVRQGLLAEAFGTMEYSRSRTLLEILTDDPVEPRNRLAELRRKNQEMRREIMRRTEELAALPASADRDSATTAVLRTLRELRRRHDDLRAEIAAEVPDADAAAAVPLTLAQVQAMIDRGSAVIEYYVTKNELVVFLITRNAVRAVTRPESETHLAAKVKLLRATLGGEAGSRGSHTQRRASSEPPWEPSAAALTTALLEPLRGDPLLAGVKRLVVVPHKFLHYVPFQALTIGDDGGRPRFLVEDYVVSYAPSASVLKHCLDRDRGRRTTVLAVANPTTRSSQGELLYAGDEVRSLQRRFGDGAVVRIGRDATETAFKEEAGHYDLLHIATHFIVNPRDPLRSALDLTPTSRDDGRLEVREVMDLGVDADLVVLNGCFTAAGGGPVDRLPDGDDWVGLTRAFIYAGAPSVIATLWPVNDRSASRFMDRFYELLPVKGKSEALAQAQRDMIDGLIPGTAGCADPYHWAPFVLIGSSD